MSFRDDYEASRRLFVLRLLVELAGTANESVIRSAAQKGGFAQSTADDVRRDLDQLRSLGCITEEWIDRLRVVSVTERGEDVAYGRAAVDGIEHSIWRKG